MAMQIIQREELCKRISKWRAPRKTKISLDDYLNLLDSRNYSDLSISFLNQIISMHGYKKIYKVPKKVVAEAVSGISLVNPSCSTLNDEISPSVSLLVETVVSDLNQLNWQECAITSVQTLNSSIQVAISSSSAPLDPKAHFSDSSEHKAKQKALVTKKNGGSCASSGKKQKALVTKENDSSCASSGEKLKVKRSKRVVMGKKLDSVDCVPFGSAESIGNARIFSV